jgi:DNA-binding PadR family transcriptional regulator
VEAFGSDASGASGPVPMTGSLTGEFAAFRARTARGTKPTKPGKPSKTGKSGGRGKKVYGITDRGEALFEELLAAESQSSEDERMFNLRLAFARYLPPDARLGMLERRRAQLLERLVLMRTRVKAVRDDYARSLMEHDREAAEHDLSWIERLIASERAGRDPDGGHRPTRSGGRTRSRGVARDAVETMGAHAPSISGLRPGTSQEENTQ